MANESAIIYDDELLLAAENDTETQLDSTEFDPDADYAAAPPPLPDGWHLATLKNRGVKSDDKVKEFDGPRPWGNIPSTYWTMVEAIVSDPEGPQNNKRATGNITTHAEKTMDGRPRGSAAAMYYKAMTDQTIPGVSQGTHIALVAKELRSEPQVWVRTQLEGSDQDAQQAYRERKKNGQLEPGEKAPPTFRGQKNFTDAQGRLTGVKVLEDGTRIVGRPVIAEVKPKSFQPPAKR